jgi:hypothetical protein
MHVHERAPHDGALYVENEDEGAFGSREKHYG